MGYCVGQAHVVCRLGGVDEGTLATGTSIITVAHECVGGEQFGLCASLIYWESFPLPSVDMKQKCV